jgi:mercuric ion transport protein
MRVEQPSQTQRAERLGLAGAIGAIVVASLCCVVPFVLVSVGITGPWLAALQVFEPYRIPLDAVSVGALGSAWAVHLLRVRACRAQGACALPQRLRTTRTGLLIATILIVALIAAPYVIAYFGGISS